MTFPLLRAQPLVALDEGPNDRPRTEAWPRDDEESAESRARPLGAKLQPPQEKSPNAESSRREARPRDPHDLAAIRAVEEARLDQRATKMRTKGLIPWLDAESK